MLIKAFFSDPHFGHKRVIEYCNRPFESVRHMNEEMIKRYNALIQPEDTVLWCGDCFFCPVEVAKQIMASLNGRKILIVGNHDRGQGAMAKIGFDIVMDECVMNIGDRVVRIKHYPYAGNKMSDGGLENRYLDRRPQRIKGEVLIHGHTHQKTKVNENMVHVGVDSWDYSPALFSDVEELIKKI